MNIKFFISVWLTITGFLISLTVFSIVYKSHGYKPYPEAQTISGEVNRTNFIAVGDIMLSRLVARQTEKTDNPWWIWMNISSFLQESDFNIWNLESPTNGTDVYSYEKTMVFNALPHLIETLSQVNFWVINLANNHAMDQGEEWLIKTQRILEKHNIIHIGTGANLEEAWIPKIVEKNGIKIAFIGASYASFNDDGSKNSPMIARMQDVKNLQSAIKKAKEETHYVVVSMHAGQEYTREPTNLQREFAHAAIEWGADIVIGAHPHWTQKIESYKGKYIFYSLGNFVFDQEFSPETKTGLAIQVFLEKNQNEVHMTHIELHPVIIENYGQPRLMSGEEKIKALSEIDQSSNTLH
jgi:poly-gamma-glutamate capsule biosynthesis protein CapA/YwtB (metallophosphatase superfamily)